MAKNLIDWIKERIDQNPDQAGVQLVSPKLQQGINDATGNLRGFFSNAANQAVKIAQPAADFITGTNNDTQGYTPSLPLRAAAAVQTAVKPATDYLEKPFTFADQMAQNPSPAFKIASIPAGVVQSSANTPQLIYKGGKDLTGDVQGIASGHPSTPQQVIAHGMSLLEGLTNLLGVGGAAKIGVNLGEQALKDVIIQGAKQGGLYGGAYGLMQGLENNGNAASVPEQFGKAIPSTIQGGVTGAVAGGVLAGSGWKIADLIDQRTQRINLDKVNQMLDEYHAAEKAGNLSPEESKNLALVNTMLKEYKAKEAQFTPPAIPKEPLVTQPLNAYQKLVLEPQRYFQKVLGDSYPAFKQQVFDKLSQAKGDMADWKTAANQRVESLGIKAGSQDSALIQKVGEGKLNQEQLIAQVGEQRAKKINNAINVFRQIYNETRDFANARRTAAGLPEIPFKADYFRHTGDAPSFLNSFTGAGERSASIMKKSSETTNFDAVKGFSSYIEKAGQAGFIDPLVPQFEKVSKTLAKQGAHPQITDYLDNWITHQIQGITKAPTNNELVNQAIGVGDKLVGNVKKNQILFNAASVVNQGGNVPGAAWDVGTKPGGAMDVVKGTMNFIKNAVQLDKSNFFKDRLYSQPGSFEGNWLKKFQNAGGTAIEKADTVFSKYIGSLYYEQALRNGIKDPINYAGDMTQAAVGGRGIGDRSLLQASKLGTTLVPFSLEVQNNINKIAEMAGDKRYGALVGLAFTNFGLNAATKALTGSAPFIDPIGAAIESYNQLTGQNGKNPNAIKSVGILINEALKFSPMAQNVVASMYPIAQSLVAVNGTSLIPDSQDLFGTQDPTRFGSANMYLQPLLDKNFMEVIAKYNPIGGGNQLKKTVEGVKAGINGYTTSKYGNVTSPANQDILSRAQMALFGQWSNAKTQDFFSKEGNKSLTKSQSDVYRTMSPAVRDTFFNSAQEVNQQKAAGDAGTNIFAKIMGSGTPSDVNMDTSKMTKAQKQAMLTVIDKKLSNGGDITPQEVQLKYFDKYDSMPTSTQYEKDMQYGEGFKAAKAVYNDQYASDTTRAQVLQKAGISEEEVQYNIVASSNDTNQTQFVQESLAKLDPKARDAFLLRGRSMVDNQMLLSDAVVSRLEKAGTISSAEAETLKSLTFVRDPSYKGKDGVVLGNTPYKPVATNVNGSGKVNKVAYKVAGTELKSSKLTSPKIKIVAPTALKALKIKSPKLQAGKNWRSIKLKA